VARFLPPQFVPYRRKITNFSMSRSKYKVRARFAFYQLSKWCLFFLANRPGYQKDKLDILFDVFIWITQNIVIIKKCTETKHNKYNYLFSSGDSEKTITSSSGNELTESANSHYIDTRPPGYNWHTILPSKHL